MPRKGKPWSNLRVQIQMSPEVGAAYKSPAQRARVISEAWGKCNLYCAHCYSSTLEGLPPNTSTADYACPSCGSTFQLKSQSRPLTERVVDAAYEPMKRAIMEGSTPNLFSLYYDRSVWEVRDLVLIPRFVFSLSSIERRKALGPTARRKGWVGCNILLANIPPDAKIPVVSHGVPTDPEWVRKQYARLRPLENFGHEVRGWTLDVLNVVRSLKQREFSLRDVYASEERLQKLHPNNRHVHEKIRQQLQRLRDLRLIEFCGGGRYRQGELWA